MTISTTNSRINQVANGIQTVFIYDFIIQTIDQMHVYFDNVEQFAGFSVSGAGNPAGGDVTFFPTAPANGIVVSLVRIVPETQEVDYQPYDPFPAETHEGALDKLTLITQQNTDALTRAVKVPFDDDGTLDLTLPPYVAGKGLMYSEIVQEIVTSDDDINGITAAAQASADAAAASAAAAANSETNALTSANNADATLKEFETQYLGSKAADPTVDNEGNPLIDGALYFSTTIDAIRVYSLTGLSWSTFGTSAGVDDQATTLQVVITDTEVTFSNDIALLDSKRLYLGTGNLAWLTHSGASATFTNSVGDFYHESLAPSSALIFVNHDSVGASKIGMALGGAIPSVQLFHNGIVKLETVETGIDVPGVSTELKALRVGAGRAGSGSSEITLIGDTTYPSYGAKLIRNAGGPGASTDLLHRGVGALNLNALEAGPITFATQNILRGYWDPDGGFVVGSPPGLSQGPGTINAVGLYANGVLVQGGAPVTNYVAGGTSYVHDEAGVDLTNSLIGFQVLDTWVTYGPTGSGATVIWTALDSVPVTAKWVEIRIFDILQGSTIATAYGSFWFSRAGGSTAANSNDTTCAMVGFTNQSGAGERDQAVTPVKIPLGPGRIFELYHQAFGTGFSDNSQANLIGFGV